MCVTITELAGTAVTRLASIQKIPGSNSVWVLALQSLSLSLSEPPHSEGSL